MKASPLFYVGSLGMVAVAFIASLLVLAASGTSALTFLLLGGFAWIASVGLKFAWASKINNFFFRFLKQKLSPKISGSVSWIYVGLLTGVFECGIALLFVLNIEKLYDANWASALAFGVGFGAAEAFLLGFFSLFQALKEKRKTALELLTSQLAPIIERIFALSVHAFSKVLIVLAVQQSNYTLFWYSFGFKSLLDAIATFGIMRWKVLDKLSRIWIMELIVAIFGLISVLGLWLLRPA